MDQTILKTLYLNFESDQKTGYKIRDDALFYVIAGSDGSRTIKIKPKPNYTFYHAIEEMRYHRLSCDIDKCTPITVPYLKRDSEMAKVVGLSDEYRFAKQDWRTKRDWVKKNLYGHPQLYMADMHIEDVFKLKFNQIHGEHSADIEYRTSFMDIEVRADKDDFNQHKALVPICSICHVDSATETVYVMVLDDPEVPLIREVFGNLKDFMKYLRTYLKEVRQTAMDMIKADGGNPDSVHSFDFKFSFTLFDTEADLIQGYADMLKVTKPDFCACWGINFDMITIKNRAEKLGLNVADLFSDPIIPPEFREFTYSEDRDRFNSKSATHYSRYFDKILTTGLTQFYCQMSMHSNLRKRFQEKNYKLDTIGEKYAYIKKVDLASEGYHIKDVYVKNFRVFLKYAILDPIVQFMIERANADIPRYMITCKDTRFTHGIRKTYGIKNELATFLRDKKHAIIGNDKSYDIFEPIPGAIIASPKLIERKGIQVMGTDTFIFRNLCDLDLNAEYPNIMIAYNILKTTIFGRITSIVFCRVLEEGMTINVPISDGAEFNRMLETIDTSIFDIGQKYFGLPSVEDIVNLIENSAIRR